MNRLSDVRVVVLGLANPKVSWWYVTISGAHLFVNNVHAERKRDLSGSDSVVKNLDDCAFGARTGHRCPLLRAHANS